MTKPLVFVPCYNCEDQIRRTLSGVQSSLVISELDVLVLDNCSQDKTFAVAQEFVQKNQLSNIQVQQNPTNLGLGGSFKKASLKAKSEGYTHLLILHGDDQADIQDAEKMILNLSSNTATQLGARFMKGASLTNYSAIRRFVNLCFNWLMSLLFFRIVHDIGSGLNLYQLSALPDKLIHRLDSHAAFDIDILLYLLSSKASFRFVPIQWKSVDEISTVNDWLIGYRLLVKIFYWRLCNTSLHVK